ncbi:DNA sulfur modification protein DndD [Cyanobacterium aponinum]|uniref:Nuclease SbcCD subunit C n=1 Tax=Cyanobacterium aponinum (strain PCC 10605) TaxID=755178 RepID=K9Z054_CYAAP|nr:DNA sulfur modification protein DndD [Cyanobacterium aponinum]AFZ52549.1 DNA sulfur modification protein DndD [Cyanobacterium aponinum PCC 10605]
MLIFKELILENFGPYQGINIINLAPKNNDDAPIILFGGMNGGGKTTLMDSIRLALYGRRAECSSRDNLSYRDFLNQCINKNIGLGEKTTIELTFEHIVNNQWKELKIIRFWEKNSRDGSDNLSILEDHYPELNLTENWDDYIEKFLPLGISSLFLFDGEQVKELAEQELPTTSVKDAIKSLLGLELADKLALDLDVLVSRKQKDIDKYSDSSELADIENNLSKLELEKRDLLEDLKKEESQLKKVQKNYRQVSQNLRDIGIKLATEKEQLKGKKALLENNIETLRSHLKNLSAKLLPLGLIQNLLNDLDIQLKEQSRLKSLNIAHTLWQEKDYKLLDFLEKINISNETYQKIKDYLDKEQFTISQQLNSQTIYLPIEDNTLTNFAHKFHQILPLQQEEAKKIIEELNQIEEELILTEQLLAQMDSPTQYKQLEKECQKQETTLISVKSRCETLKKDIDNITQKIIEARKKLGSYGEDNLKNQQIQHIFDVLPKVKQTLTLFQEKLTLRKLNKLESEVTNCFRYLLHKSNFISKVAIASDTFALSLYNEQGNLIEKNRLSAGEKQILAISLLWGLARVSEKNLPIAIDTPLGRLDSSHRYNLVERYFPTASHQVILLSTDTEIGEQEVNFLREKQVIAKEYLLEHDNKKNQTRIKEGYFY